LISAERDRPRVGTSSAIMARTCGRAGTPRASGGCFAVDVEAFFLPEEREISRAEGMEKQMSKQLSRNVMRSPGK
jgi:hypothetical protein